MLIELGDRSTGPSDSPRPPWLRPERRRGALVAGVALAALLLLVSSVVAPGSAPRAIASLPIGTDARLLVTGAHAVIVDTNAQQSQISSYALPGGAREWSSPIVGTAAASDTFVTGHTIIVDAPVNGTDDLDIVPDQLFSNVIQAFDVRTGRPVWQHSVNVAFMIRSGLLEYVAVDAETEGVRVIDPATGATRWSVRIRARQADGACATELDRTDPAQASALLEVCTVRDAGTGDVSGTVQRLDLTTGAITARNALHFSTNPRNPDEPASLMLVGNTAIVSLDNVGATSMAAFRTDDLTHLWSLDSPTYDIVLQSCGVHLCVTSVDDGSLRVVDPDTGLAIPDDPTNDHGSGPIVTIDSSVPVYTTLVVALRPGQHRLGNTAMLGVDFAYAAPADRSVQLLPAAVGHTWIARLIQTGDAQTVSAIWYLPGFRDGCVVIDTYLACSDRPHHLSLWRLPM